MVELGKIQEFQEKFDKAHGWCWSSPKDIHEKLSFLQYVTVALLGELGEFANILKKIVRNYNSLHIDPDEKSFEMLKEELVDLFIYLLIAANILHMDLEKVYFKKMKFNEKRFKKYETG